MGFEQMKPDGNRSALNSIDVSNHIRYSQDKLKQTHLNTLSFAGQYSQKANQRHTPNSYLANGGFLPNHSQNVVNNYMNAPLNEDSTIQPQVLAQT